MTAPHERRRRSHPGTAPHVWYTPHSHTQHIHNVTHTARTTRPHHRTLTSCGQTADSLPAPSSAPGRALKRAAKVPRQPLNCSTLMRA
eukprot:5129048-Prymnesium_polylepis.1